MKSFFGKKVRKYFEYATGWNIYTINPRGGSLQKDIKKYLSKIEIKMIFDVGAHKGFLTEKYSNIYPSADIYSFEPVKESYSKLEKKFLEIERIHCFRRAFGSKRGMKEMVLADSSDRFRLEEHYDETEKKQPKEKVNVDTIDKFCNQKGINKINFLKVDTEGHDLEVVKGSKKMMRKRKIDIIQVETSMSPKNKIHEKFEKVKKYMENKKYLLFSIYEQRGEWDYEDIPLRRVDAVFVSPNIYE